MDPTPSASGFYDRQAGRPNKAGFEIFKILYRLNNLDFYFVDIIYSAISLIVLEVHFNLLF